MVVEGVDRRDLEYQPDRLHEDGTLCGEVLFGENNADDCDDLDEYDGDSPDECETATSAKPVVGVPKEDAAGSVESRTSWPCGWLMAPRAPIILPKPAADGECQCATQKRQNVIRRVEKRIVCFST